MSATSEDGPASSEGPDQPAGRSRRTPSTALLVIGLIVVAGNLRIAIAAVSPVLTSIQDDLNLSTSEGGLLTTVPVICFGLFSFVTPRLTRRFGMSRLLWMAMLLLTAGILIRLVPSVLMLFAGTAVLGAAIAVANVLMPGLVKSGFADPRHVSLMTGTYTMALSGGAALSAGLTIPLQHLTGLGWRPVLAIWAVPAVIAVVVWSPQLRRRAAASSRAPAGVLAAEPLSPPPPRALWSDRVAWSVTLFMGLQSLGYYGTLTWIPTLLQDHHMAIGQAGWMLSFSSLPAIAASMAAPLVARRLRRPWIMVAVAMVLCAVAYLGLLWDPVSLAYVWMAALGLGQGSAISLALGYIVLRSPDTHHTGQLSTMAQGAGYLIASIGPFGLGAIHALTGSWTVPLLVLLAVLVVALLAGLSACKPRHVLAGR